MKRKLFAFSLIILLGLGAVFSYASAKEKVIPIHKLVVFYSINCARCTHIKDYIMPEIEKQYTDHMSVQYRNIDEMGNYQFLLGLKEKYKSDIANAWPVFYLEGQFLNGEGEVKQNLIALIEEAIKNDVTIIEEEVPKIDLVKFFKSFTVLAIISAGLIDGINPCAFTVIVFFISFLALQGYKKRDLVIIGLTFIFAVFLTYILIGLGIFGFFYRLKGFWIVSRAFNFSMGILSVTLGILALYDLFKFKRTGETEGLVLQLPQAVKNQIHRVIGQEYRIDKNKQGEGVNKNIFSLVLGAFVTGILVSILEAVCTGQVYLPTITFVLKITKFKLQALWYFLLYNLMFITPLIIIFLFALLGVTSEEFSRFLKKHMVSVKILMAILFFGLGIFLLWKV